MFQTEKDLVSKPPYLMMNIELTSVKATRADLEKRETDFNLGKIIN